MTNADSPSSLIASTYSPIDRLPEKTASQSISSTAPASAIARICSMVAS